MTVEQAEVCYKVADIIDFDSDRFNMGLWEEDFTCGTVACIAGHIGLFHNDSHGILMERTHRMSQASADEHLEHWHRRQADRIGLNPDAGDVLFLSTEMTNPELSELMRKLGKAVEERGYGDFLGLDELREMRIDIAADLAPVGNDRETHTTERMLKRERNNNE